MKLPVEGERVIVRATYEGSAQYDNDVRLRFKASPAVTMPVSWVDRGEIVASETDYLSGFATKDLLGILWRRLIRVFGRLRPLSEAENERIYQRLRRPPAPVEPPSLTLAQITRINTERSPRLFPQCEDWSLMEWAGASAFEAGEAGNFAKKIKRDGHTEELLMSFGYELADNLHYLTMCAAKAGINLDWFAAMKFNQLSVLKEDPARLPIHGTPLLEKQ